MQLFIKIGDILLQYHLVRISVTDSDKNGNHIGWRHLQFRFYDVMLFIQWYPHGAAQSFCGCRQEYVFSITHQMVESGFSLETYVPFNSLHLKTGITTQGVFLSIVYCLGICHLNNLVPLIFRHLSDRYMILSQKVLDN